MQNRRGEETTVTEVVVSVCLFCWFCSEHEVDGALFSQVLARPGAIGRVVFGGHKGPVLPGQAQCNKDAGLSSAAALPAATRAGQSRGCAVLAWISSNFFPGL